MCECAADLDKVRMEELHDDIELQQPMDVEMQEAEPWRMVARKRSRASPPSLLASLRQTRRATALQPPAAVQYNAANRGYATWLRAHGT